MKKVPPDFIAEDLINNTVGIQFTGKVISDIYDLSIEGLAEVSNQ